MLESGGATSPSECLLVDPNHAGFFQLSVFFSVFPRKGAQRNTFCVREIRSRPVSSGRGEAGRGKDVLFRGHGRITCVGIMTRKLRDRHLVAETGRVILRKCRGGG